MKKCFNFGLFLAVAWVFMPLLAEFPWPGATMIEGYSGPLSESAMAWSRWGIQLAAVVAGWCLGRKVLQLIRPKLQVYYTSTPVRWLAGEGFELRLVLIALGGCFAIMMAIIVGYWVVGAGRPVDWWALRGTLNDAFLEFSLPTTAIGLLCHLLVGRVRLGRALAPVVRLLDQGRYGRGGSGRLAGILEEAPLAFREQENGLYMGRSLFAPFQEIGLDGDKHMLSFGPARSGWKGSAVIIPNVLRMPPISSLLVVDPKRTIATVTGRYLAEQGKRVYVVEPYGEHTACFNPLDDLDPNDLTIRKRLNSIADAVVIPTPNQRDPHWDRSSKVMIAGLTGHVLTTYRDPNLTMIRELLCLPVDQLTMIWEEMAQSDCAGGLPREAASRILRSEGTNELLSVLATVDSHTEWLSDPAIARVLSRSDFNMSDLKRHPTAIFVCIPVESLKTMRGFNRLFVNQQLEAMPRGGRSTIPILSIVDEAAGLGRMEAISDAYRMTTNYNFTLWCLAQDLPSMDCYGSDLQSMMACSRGVQILGAGDLTTARYVSDVLGKHYVNGCLVPLRSPDEVIRDLSVASERQYVLRSGETPLLLRKVRYFDDPKLKGRYDADPDFVKS